MIDDLKNYSAPVDSFAIIEESAACVAFGVLLVLAAFFAPVM